MADTTVFDIQVVEDSEWAGSISPYFVIHKGRRIGPLDAGQVERQIASSIELAMHNYEWVRSRRNGAR